MSFTDAEATARAAALARRAFTVAAEGVVAFRAVAFGLAEPAVVARDLAAPDAEGPAFGDAAARTEGVTVAVGWAAAVTLLSTGLAAAGPVVA
jgi:hypothetical protein